MESKTLFTDSMTAQMAQPGCKVDDRGALTAQHSLHRQSAAKIGVTYVQPGSKVSLASLVWLKQACACLVTLAATVRGLRARASFAVQVSIVVAVAHHARTVPLLRS
jgi:hypothetical protein